MIKTISKIGNSQGIILDAALMELTHLNQNLLEHDEDLKITEEVSESLL